LGDELLVKIASRSVPDMASPHQAPARAVCNESSTCVLSIQRIRDLVRPKGLGCLWIIGYSYEPCQLLEDGTGAPFLYDSVSWNGRKRLALPACRGDRKPGC